MILCMRTTIQLDDQLLAEAKKYAAETGRSLKSLIESGLRESLARRHNEAPKQAIQLRTFKGDGLQPGVDLDDGASLLDMMDS